MRRALAWCLAAVAALAGADDARAAFDNTTPRGTFAGTHNYTITGGTLRTQSNAGNACAVGASSNANIAGIPAGATIMAAYLYWAGSGNVDATVTLNGTPITADATFTDNFQTFLNNQDYDLDYFGGFEDVTSLVTGNGSFTFSGLTVATTDNFGGNPDADYCGPSAVIAGWSLVVVYSHASERYRYTRIYDGLQYFRGSSVTTTQSGFRVPDLVDGKVTVVTWEGDPDANSSQSLDGFNETLTFDGYQLLNAGCDASNNLYNSTIGTPTGGCNTAAYGLDIDTYDVTNFLYEGQTGATLTYSSGNDLVFLTAQVISTTNTPVADLGIAKTHTGNFTAGQNHSFQIVVHNYGPEIATGTTTVTDVLPTGLTYLSASGTGWTCGAAGQTVTCNHSSTTLAIGADLPTLTLNVAVSGSAAASIDNTATVSHPMFDGTGGNQSSTDTVTVLRSNLSTSTKTVVDLDGGEVEVGDVLRYTITLNETGGQGVAASGVTVVDDLPVDLDSLSIVSIPAGATDQSIGSGGANGTGQVKVTGITVPAAGSVTIVFDATVKATADPGDTITNTATVTNGSGPGATPSIGTVVAASQAPATGNKVLYVYNNMTLTRVAQTTNSTAGVEIAGAGASATWSLTAPVATGQTLVLPAQTVGVQLVTRAGGASTGSNRSVQVELLDNGAVIGTASVNVVGTGNTLRTWNISIPQTTLSAGEALQMRVTNNVAQSNRDIFVVSRTAANNYSRLSFDSNNVVNVDQVTFHTGAYPAAGTQASWQPGDVVRIRADASDPFGGYDVTSAVLTLTDADGTVILNAVAMPAATSPTNNGTPNRIFEYQYTIPANPDFGNWTASVTAREGTENTVTHTRNGTMKVEPDALAVVKSHSGNFTAGANAQYTLQVNNTGTGAVSGTTTVTDTLATGLTYVSGTGTGWTCGAVGQLVTCTSNTAIPGSGAMAPITLTVAVAGNMGSSVDNQASVGNSSIGGGFMTAGNIDTATILHPNLSTSTKTVLDTNGGDAEPGDTLRYTITLVESAGVAANAVSVSDPLQAGLTSFTINAGLTTCNGTNTSTSTTVSRTGISLAASASCTIVFDAVVSAFAGAGLEINNTATITNPNGPGATPAAPTVIVSQSQQASTGNKVLYVYADNTMSRVPQAAAAAGLIPENGSASYTLGALAAPLTFTPGTTIDVSLWLARAGTTSGVRSIYVQLFKNGVAQIGGNSNTIDIGATLARQNFTINVPTLGGATFLSAGDTVVLRIVNTSSGTGTLTATFQQFNAGEGSVVSFATSTVVNVDSVNTYAVPYDTNPSATPVTHFKPGDTVYVRAVTSDPFGWADISAANLVVTDSNGATQLASSSMTSKANTTATRTWERAFTVPPAGIDGGWTATVTALEGTEGTVTHSGNAGFSVGGRVTLDAVWGAGAAAGHQVSLAIAGGTSATGGSSTAPSTTTPATALADIGATVTLTQVFTVGAASAYTITLACEKASDGTTVPVSGTGLSRSFTMPEGSVECTWTIGLTIPVTVVKLSSVVSDPINGTTNPKSIPGAVIEYQMILTNPATRAVDANTLVVSDEVPAHVDLRVADIGGAGSGPVQYTNGTPASGLTYTFTSLSSATDDVDFSNDNGATWTYVPVPDAGGRDPAVTDIRIRPQGAFAANGAQFTLRFRVVVE